ncbi:hypothetical protein D3C81_1812260 [compost metagenome]
MWPSRISTISACDRMPLWSRKMMSPSPSFVMQPANMAARALLSRGIGSTSSPKKCTMLSTESTRKPTVVSSRRTTMTRWSSVDAVPDAGACSRAPKSTTATWLPRKCMRPRHSSLFSRELCSSGTRMISWMASISKANVAPAAWKLTHWRRSLCAW